MDTADPEANTEKASLARLLQRERQRRASEGAVVTDALENVEDEATKKLLKSEQDPYSIKFENSATRSRRKPTDGFHNDFVDPDQIHDLDS